MRQESSAEPAKLVISESRGARPRDVVQSLERGVAILTVFDEEHHTMNLTDIAQRCGLPRSATRRFLQTLADLGYITASGRRYSLTPQVLELGYSYLPKLSLTDVARPHAIGLARDLAASVSVAVLDGLDVRYIHRANVRSALSVAIKVGSRAPAHSTALGRVLLATMTDAQLTEHMVACGRAGGDHHLDTKGRSAFVHAINLVRRQKWSYVDRLADVGVRAVAVPLRNRDGEVVAAMSASLHDAKLPIQTMISHFIPPLQEKAARISLELRRGIEP